MLDGVFQDVPDAMNQYIHYASNAFNIALALFNCDQINDAAILARLSCEAGRKWYLLKSDDSNAINKVGNCIYDSICLSKDLEFVHA